MSMKQVSLLIRALAIGRWIFGLLFCDFFVTCDVMMCTSSIFHLCTISAERYIGIRYPLWSKNKSKRIVLLKIVFVWTLAFAVTSPITVLGIVQSENILVDGQCQLNNEHFVIYGSIFAFFIPLSIMVIMYILTVRMLNKQAKLCHKRRGEDGEVEPMIRRSTSSKRWQGRQRCYGGGSGGGGGGDVDGFQTSFRNHDVMKEHIILDGGGNFHPQQHLFEMSTDCGGGGGGGRGEVEGGGGAGGEGTRNCKTLPHFRSSSPFSSMSSSVPHTNSLLRRGMNVQHEVNNATGNVGGGGSGNGGGGRSCVINLSLSGNNSPLTKRRTTNGSATYINNNRSPSHHQDPSIMLTNNSKNGKKHQSHYNFGRSRSSYFGDVTNKRNDVIGKNSKHNKSKSSSEYLSCNGQHNSNRSDSSGEDNSFREDGHGNGLSSLSSSSSNKAKNDKRLKDLVKKHHVALRAANILLMRRVDQSGKAQNNQNNVHNHHHHHHHNHHHHFMTSSAMPRTSTTTPPSSTKVSIRRDNSVKTEQKATKVLGVVFIIFVFCWAPFFIVNVLTVLISSLQFGSTLFHSFVWLGYVSSTLNPIIYTIFNNIFRNTFIKLLCCRYRLLHRARRNSNMSRKDNGMLASSTCSATYNTATTILSSASSNCNSSSSGCGGVGNNMAVNSNCNSGTCNISFRNKASASINIMDESKC